MSYDRLVPAEPMTDAPAALDLAVRRDQAKMGLLVLLDALERETGESLARAVDRAEVALRAVGRHGRAASETGHLVAAAVGALDRACRGERTPADRARFAQRVGLVLEPALAKVPLARWEVAASFWRGKDADHGGARQKGKKATTYSWAAVIADLLNITPNAVRVAMDRIQDYTAVRVTATGEGAPSDHDQGSETRRRNTPPHSR